MRRWTLTLFLLGCAASAAVLAPRLIGRSPDPVPVAETPSPAIVETPALIPELDEPPVPDSFWDDCPACGMG